MKETKSLRRAQIHLSKLANGLDPFTGRELPGDSVLNNVNLARSFFLAADLLDQVIRNGGTVGHFTEKALEPFSITEEERAQVIIFDTPISVRHIAENISAFVDPARMRKLSPALITDWLVHKGFLRYDAEAKRHTVTETAAAVGIVTERRDTVMGDYTAVIYTKEAQAYIVDHLGEMLAFAQTSKAPMSL